MCISNVISESLAKELYLLGIRGKTRFNYVDIMWQSYTILCEIENRNGTVVATNIIDISPKDGLNLIGKGSLISFSGNDKIYPAYSLIEVVAMFGNNKLSMQILKDRIDDELKVGNFFHIAYDVNFVCNALIRCIELGNITVEEINSILEQKDSHLQ